MSLDLYAGPLWRYYSREFKTPQQRLAEEHHLNYRLEYENDPPNWPRPIESREKVSAFRSSVAEIAGADVASWAEEYPSYKVEQLNWDAQKALLLISAYNHRKELTRPTRLPNSLDADKAYSEAYEAGYYFGPLAVLEAHIYLPGEIDRIFLAKDPMGWKQVVTSTGNLRHTLDRLSSEIWSNQTSADEWFSRGCHPTDGKVLRPKRGLFPWDREWIEESEDTTDDVVLYDAEYAYGCYKRILNYAEQHKVPVKKDS